MKLLTIKILITLALFTGIATACSEDEQDVTIAQAESIEAYLKWIDNQPDENKKYDYWFQNDVYHVTIKQGNRNEPVKEGSEITFEYVAATFNQGNELALGKIFYTNIKEVAKNNQLDTLRNFAPEKTIAGKGGYIKGLEKGLLQMNKGETALLIFTSAQGYGDKDMSIIPKNTPLTFLVYMK